MMALGRNGLSCSYSCHFLLIMCTFKKVSKPTFGVPLIRIVVIVLDSLPISYSGWALPAFSHKLLRLTHSYNSSSNRNSSIVITSAAFRPQLI